MHKRDRKRIGGSIPLGFLGMISMIVVIEQFAVRRAVLLPNPEFGGVTWNYAPLGIKSKTLGREILCFGDSFINIGIVPAILHEQTGKRAYNLAIRSGSAPSSYFLLLRSVTAGARPRAIIVDFDKGILADDPSSAKRPYPWSELLSLRDTLELCWIARDANLFADILVKTTLRSANVRLEIRRQILTALKGETDREHEVVFATWRNLNQNQGANLFDKNPNFKDAPLFSHPPPKLPGTWVCDRVNGAYLEKFLELAGQIHARVYWLLPPASPGWQSISEYLGDEARYVRFIRRMQQRHPHVVVVDGRYAGFKADVFLDGYHLDRDGAMALTAGVGEIIRRTQTRSALSSRWIDLPTYAAPSGPDRSEVFSKSLSIARMGRAAQTVTK